MWKDIRGEPDLARQSLQPLLTSSAACSERSTAAQAHLLSSPLLSHEKLQPNVVGSARNLILVASLRAALELMESAYNRLLMAHCQLVA